MEIWSRQFEHSEILIYTSIDLLLALALALLLLEFCECGEEERRLCGIKIIKGEKLSILLKTVMS